MKDKIYEFLNNDLDEFELKVLKRDIEGGGNMTQSLIEKRLRVLKREQQKECLVCGKLLRQYNSKFMLLFGPDDFQKRASFCAVDCLEYFLKKVKKKGTEKKKPVSPNKSL